MHYNILKHSTLWYLSESKLKIGELLAIVLDSRIQEVTAFIVISILDLFHYLLYIFLFSVTTGIPKHTFLLLQL